MGSFGLDHQDKQRILGSCHLDPSDREVEPFKTLSILQWRYNDKEIHSNKQIYQSEFDREIIILYILNQQ